MRKKRILITAGPTQEPIDPVRFISNQSTGEMGLRLAEEARRAGHAVTLLLGPVRANVPRGIRLRSFRTTADLKQLLRKEFPKHDVLFMSAAVSDYTPVKSVQQKIKRAKMLTLRLRSTPDLLRGLELIRRKQTVVGFCLETGELERKAGKKLRAKKLDYIVGNFLSRTHNPFGDGNTSVLILDKGGKSIWLEDKPKREIARFLIREVCGL